MLLEYDIYSNVCFFLVKEENKLVKTTFTVAHNARNFGNYLFGAGAYSLNLSYVMIILGAHYNSLFNVETNGYNPQLDSSDDQFSIRMGILHAKNNNYRSLQYE